jgi:hypothetical protein
VRDKAYFQLVEHPVEARQAASCVYKSPDAGTIKAFNSVNGFGKPNETIYPGQLLLVPSLDGLSDQSAGSFQQIPQIVNYTSRNATSPVDAAVFNKDFSLLTPMANSDQLSNYFGGVSDYMNVRLKMVTSDFKKLEAAYQTAKVKKINLSSNEFRAMRSPIEQSLKQQLTGFSKSAILRRANAPSMKDALGISHHSLSKQFRASGNVGEVKQISQAISKTANLTKVAKKLGTVGVVLSYGSIVPTIVNTYKTEGLDPAMKTLGRESAGFLGGLGGGVAGAEIGGGAAAAAILAFGVGTGGLGFVAVGLAAVAGGVIGSTLGSEAGKSSFDGAMTVSEHATDWLVKQTMD